MTTEQMNELCVKSADEYLNFLYENEKHRSVDEVDVNDIEYNRKDKILIFSIGKKINDAFLSNIFFLIDDEKIIPSNDISVKYYFEETRQLHVNVFNRNILDKLFNTDINKIKIGSDLKFLVDRVKNWYKKNEKYLNIPINTNIIKFDENILKNELYPQNTQINAIKQILNGYESEEQLNTFGKKAFTYIWGAPGTGKTQVVLTYSVLNYVNEILEKEKQNIRNNKEKILLVAPTNAALEQMLYGFANALGPEETNKLKRVSKLGITSLRFKEKYKCMCDNKNEDTSIIIACTLDYYIAHSLHEMYKFKHIFLDEAGYTSLIKALTLFTNNCPITFLGDHMQLKPVCEMDNLKISKSNNSIFLWEKPAIYIQDIFMLHEYEMINKFLADRPIFDQLFDESYPMRTVALKETYRFGSELAEILDKYVYNIGFQAAKQNTKTNIYFIDAVYNCQRKSSSDRSNIAEANAIAEFIKNISTKNKNKNIAVLTPYKNQVTAIVKKIEKPIKKDDVYTIHASQGKEWDTVIFSVADNDKGNNTRYFTDSQKKGVDGLSLINTAVSRAKNNLIIVCDYNHWISLENQLISELLKISNKIDLRYIETYPIVADKDISLNIIEQKQEEQIPNVINEVNNQVEKKVTEEKNIKQKITIQDPYKYFEENKFYNESITTVQHKKEYQPTYERYSYNTSNRNSKSKIWIFIVAIILFFVYINYRNTVYITKNGEKFHKKSCETIEYSYTQSIPRKKALESGKTPCKVCKP